MSVSRRGLKAWHQLHRGHPSRRHRLALALVFVFLDLGARTAPAFSTPSLERADIAPLDRVDRFVTKIVPTIRAHFPLIVEIQAQNLLEPFTTDGQPGLVTVAKLFEELGRQLDRFGFVASLQALADVGLAWKGDSALPDGGHGVGALSKQEWAGWSRAIIWQSFQKLRLYEATTQFFPIFLARYRD